MQLDDADARAQAARALAQMKAAEADQHAINTGGTQEEVLNTRSELVKAQAERDAAQKNYDALQKLAQTGAAAPSEVREAANRLTAAQAQLKVLQDKQQDRYSRPEVNRVEAQVDQALPLGRSVRRLAGQAQRRFIIDARALETRESLVGERRR